MQKDGTCFSVCFPINVSTHHELSSIGSQWDWAEFLDSVYMLDDSGVILVGLDAISEGILYEGWVFPAFR